MRTLALFLCSILLTSLLSGGASVVNFRKAPSGFVFGGAGVVDFPFAADDAYWARTALTSITANGATAPDGATTADGLIGTSANSSHRILNSNGETLTASASHTVSVYAKTGDKAWFVVIMDLYNGGSFVRRVVGYFDISTGATGTNSAGTTDAIVSAPNGFYKCSLTFTTASNENNSQFFFGSAGADNNDVYAGNASTVNVWVWGMSVI